MTDGTAPVTGQRELEPTASAPPWGALAFSAFLVALGAFAFALTFGIRETAVDDAFGPRLLLQALGILVGAGGAITLVQTVVASRRGVDQSVGSVVDDELATDQDALPPARIGPIPVSLATVAAIAVYVFLTPYIGFHVSTLLFCVGVLLLAGVRRVRMLVLLPISTVLFLYLVFELLLGVRFP